MVEDSVVLVGRKPTMNYVLATTLPLAEGKRVILKARGKAIAKAVDVVEVVRRRFVQNAVVEKINIGTEEGKVGNDGRQRNISTIEIILSQPKTSKK
ncbi:MAG: DNA-binding protein Alba [Candidatus Caldarchaeum sp.]|uniref:DNA/RNA-binding protein Alba n=1 Tax=Caldiarchaeum subterraneum TaxID=311458 RepID=A0A7C4E1V3_CALS0|nr:DNA-binding protein Alba [Candidatus Caldarchaeales archaeon]MDJ0273467.1 DNA-binding protein Alba [Candidatus Caldarchaeales archaeon]